MADGTEPGIPESLSHYRLARLLGKGGMGMVYEGRDRRDDSRVAIKLLYPHLATDPEFRERFEREAHVAALLRSPYTVHIIDFGLEQGWYYLVMEFVEGEAVSDRLRQGPLPPVEALRIAGDVARALEEAGARGVVHRDIKPENVLVTKEGRIKVADFGIARQMSGGGNLTMSGGFVGTPLYAAPEQANGESDHRSDVYSLGVTLYAMLTGRPPYNGSPFDVIQQHRSASIPMGPLAFLPDAVVNVVRRCMEKHPADRYQSASELGGALERARQSLSTWGSGGQPAPPAPSSPAAPSFTPAGRSGSGTIAAAPGGAPPPPPRPAVTPPPAPRPAIVAPTGAGPLGGATRIAAPSSPGVSGPPTQIAALGGMPPAGPLRAALTRRGGSSRLGWTLFDLVVAGPAVAVVLQAAEASNAVEFNFPASVMIPPEGQVTVPVRVRPRSRRWFGAPIGRSFSVFASAGGGGAGGTSATGQFDDMPRGWPVVGPILGVAAGILAPVALVAAGALGGGDGKEPVSPGDESPTPRATSAASQTAAATGTAAEGATADTTATAAARNTPTVAPATATRPAQATAAPTATPTAKPPTATNTPAGPPANSIQAGRWTFAFTVEENTCGFGLGVGQVFNTSFDFNEVGNGDGYIAPGERVDVVQQGQYNLGRFTFSYPAFDFGFDVMGNNGTVEGYAYVSNEFSSASSGSASIYEVYETNPECEIYGVD